MDRVTHEVNTVTNRDAILRLESEGFKIEDDHYISVPSSICVRVVSSGYITFGKMNKGWFLPLATYDKSTRVWTTLVQTDQKESNAEVVTPVENPKPKISMRLSMSVCPTRMEKDIDETMKWVKKLDVESVQLDVTVK